MTATSRRSRNSKEKSAMFAFGHFALPIAALLAVGLLFVGIKLFFLTSSERGGVSVIAENNTETIPDERNDPFEFTPEQPTPPVEVLPVEVTPQPIEGSGQLAGPVNPSEIGGSQSRPQQNQAAQTQSGSSGKNAPARVTPSQPSSANSARWGVQIGAFTKQEGAVTLQNEVKKQGYAASITKSDASGKTFHRVRVAAGKTREDAVKMASELEKKGYPVQVVPLR
jgi:cell division septation protein DedD